MSIGLRSAIYATLGLAMIAAAVLAYFGAFIRVTIEERAVGPFLLVYKELAGVDRSAIRDITDELKQRLEQANIPIVHPFDVFYPPNEGPNEIGFIVPLESQAAAESLGAGVRVREIPRQACMVARFPWRHAASFIVGYLRVDPALRRHRGRRGYAEAPAFAMNEGRTIVYMQPIVPAPAASLR
jgi:hypothetical protein